MQVLLTFFYHCSIKEETITLDIGEFKGIVVDSLPNGPGVLTFKEDDEMGRLKYEGDFMDGKKTGKGKMTFVSGDVYEGEFREGVPHGNGIFLYSNGQR